eukprot:CAMPEP_0182556486 /NCGR_PEP_ID=MMETSP1324-20130603/737_1 /TAXON_ID=236786 /ORGANISM="Florenciella sp., Strain RCC1587" /LENGTH=103 /DNA_ID=CAMNT_0024768387 /DNA_START=38 /DNA_END=349 /DNA_ORIENTATION=+
MAQAKGGPAFSLGDLQAGAKGLQQVEDAPKKAEGKGDDGSDAALGGLIEIWNNHGGDIEAIYAELGENPGKAIKYPPSGAEDFAQKYLDGKLTYDGDRAQAKG